MRRQRSRLNHATHASVYKAIMALRVFVFGTGGGSRGIRHPYPTYFLFLYKKNLVPARKSGVAKRRDIRLKRLRKNYDNNFDTVEA